MRLLTHRAVKDLKPGDCLVTDQPYVEKGAQFHQVVKLEKEDGGMNRIVHLQGGERLRLPAMGQVCATVDIEVER